MTRTRARLTGVVAAISVLCVWPTESLAQATAPPTQVELAIFVDAYAAWQTNGPGTLATLSGHRAFSGQGANFRAENGLSLAFVGLDASYDAKSYGAVVNLRLGQAAPLFHFHSNAESDANFGVEYLTQAYALWRPVPALELDLGMFLSPFGFESLESFRNPNYTLSALYVYGQPSWHTGLKAKWQLNDEFNLMALAANGSNNISETQQNAGLSQSPNVGAALGYTPIEALSFALGGLAALDAPRNADDGIDVFLDFVSIAKLGAFTAALNGDFILTRGDAPNGDDRHFFGGALTASYRLLDNFGLAARGEYLRDDANFRGDESVWRLLTGTLTVDVEPIPNVSNFVVRWENRWEHSNQPVFGKDSRGTADTDDDSYRRRWFESVLGVVVTTGP